MKDRNVKIDFIKTVAIIFVIGIHSTASALYEYPISSMSWKMVTFYRTLVAPAVPLFFMCSGALLFNKDKIIDIRAIFYKYIPRILIALFFWASVYEFIYIFYSYLDKGVFEKQVIKQAVNNLF